MTDNITLANLISDPKNARKHTPRNVGMIERALHEVGAARSIVVDENNVVLAGNATIEAAAAAGIERVQVVEADGQTIIAVRRSNLSPEQKAHLALYDNRAAELAEWDTDVLASLGEEIDLSAFWTKDEIAELLEQDIPTSGGGDLVPEVEEGPTRTQYGELWICGRHRILVGDSRDPEQIARLMQGERADAVVSDPPYGMRLDTSFSYSKGNEAMAIKPTKGYAPVVGDDADFDVSWIFTTFSSAKEVFLFGADYYVDTLPRFGKDGGWMVWDKKNESLRNVLGLADFELIWSKQRHKRRVYNFLWNGALGTESEDTKGRVHPTQKPVRLLEAIIAEYVEGLIVDPYLGSGATMIAADRCGARCFGIEIEPKYADVCLKRIEAESGQRAERSDG